MNPPGGNFANSAFWYEINVIVIAFLFFFVETLSSILVTIMLKEHDFPNRIIVNVCVVALLTLHSELKKAFSLFKTYFG